MTVSTREVPAFRDRIVQTAADNMSAGSRVTPGGYAVLGKERSADVAQFTLSYSRPPAEVFAAIRANGQAIGIDYADAKLFPITLSAPDCGIIFAVDTTRKISQPCRNRTPDAQLISRATPRGSS